MAEMPRKHVILVATSKVVYFHFSSNLLDLSKTDPKPLFFIRNFSRYSSLSLAFRTDTHKYQNGLSRFGTRAVTSIELFELLELSPANMVVERFTEAFSVKFPS